MACTGTLRLSDVAAEQALEPPVSTGDLAGPPMIDEDWLVLSTVHSAKGLEFDAVMSFMPRTATFPRTCRWDRPKVLRKNVVSSTSRLRGHGEIWPSTCLFATTIIEFVMITPGPSHHAFSESVRSTLVDIPATGKSQQFSGTPSTFAIDGSVVIEGQLSKLW